MARVNDQLKDAREEFGERLHHIEGEMDKTTKRKKFLEEAHELEKLTHLDRQKADQAEREKNQPKTIHIKQSQRKVVQLFKNIYVFYDSNLEDTLPEGVTILDHVLQKVNAYFHGVRHSQKLIKKFLGDVQKVKSVMGVQKNAFPMTDTEFVRLFISEHVMGTTQMQIKKMHNIKGHVPVDFNYMPESFLYCVFNKNIKQAHDHPKAGGDPLSSPVGKQSKRSLSTDPDVASPMTRAAVLESLKKAEFERN